MKAGRQGYKTNCISRYGGHYAHEIPNMIALSIWIALCVPLFAPLACPRHGVATGTWQVWTWKMHQVSRAQSAKPLVYAAEGSSDLHRFLGMAFAACLSMRRPYMDNMHCVFGTARALRSTGSDPCTPYTCCMRSVKVALSDSRGMLLGQ